MENEVIKGIEDNIQNSKSLSELIRNYLLEPKGAIELSTVQLCPIQEGLFIQDLTSPKQFELGITVLLVRCEKLVDFGEHNHELQSQLIFVMDGNIYDNQAKIMYTTGQSFFVQKTNRHSVRYYPNTQAMVFYMPKLTSL